MYIRQIHVSNFRSLKDTKVGELKELVIFYGHNNSGKSNILSFLEVFFSAKDQTFVREIRDENFLPPDQPKVFWRGYIQNFGDNFYKNNNEPIIFKVLINISTNELLSINGLPKDIKDYFESNRKKTVHYLCIRGNIAKVVNNIALMTTDHMELDNIDFYNPLGEEGKIHLGGFVIAKEDKLRSFESIISLLNNCFFKIPTNRFLMNEKELQRVDQQDIDSSSFKNWLMKISLDRESRFIFDEIKNQMKNEPFEYGDVSIARTSDNDIDIFIENKSHLKLPISHIGSGVQQTLVILSQISNSQSPIIGIEEIEINLSPLSQKVLFNNLKELIDTKKSKINQIIITTHSPHIGKRDDAVRRAVSIKDGITEVKKPSESEIESFFST